MAGHPVTFADQTPIRYQFFLEEAGERAVLVAAFAGRYRIGHLGAPDAGFMTDLTRTAAHLWNPGGVVLDLGELEYEWGDDLENLVSEGGWITARLESPDGALMRDLFGTAAAPEPRLPFAVVVGPKCWDAITTLIFGVGTPRPPTDADHVFDSLPAAIKYVRGPRASA